LRKLPNGISRAEKRLHSAIQEMLEDKTNKKVDNNQFPDEMSFNAVISSYAKIASKDRQAARRAEGLLRKMKDLSNSFPSLRPTIFTYNAVMEAFSRHATAKQRNSPIMQQISDSILRLYQELQDEGLSPNTYTWNLLLASTSQTSGQWQELEKWATEYLRKNDSRDDNIEKKIPDRQTYNTLFNLYAENGNYEKAEVLLRAILAWIRENNKSQDDRTSLKPSKVWYNFVLKALAVSQRRSGVNQDGNASRILAEMTELSHTTQMKALQPDTFTFNHVLNVFALSGNVNAAMALLEEMEDTYNSDPEKNADHKPDCFSYTTVIKSFATLQQNLESTASIHNLHDLAEKATEIFDRMKSRVSPNMITYNTLINIWANVKTRDALLKAEGLFQEAPQPDSFSYSSMIHGWSRTRLPEACNRAHGYFNELLDLPPSRQRKNFSITTLANSVISAYAKSEEVDAAKKAETVLAQLEGRFLNGDASAQPDKTTFLAILDAYAKACIADAEERCDTVLNRMDHYREVFQLDGLDPDRNVYNAYLNALAKSQQPSAVDKAEEILTMMETSRNPDLRPDIVTYSTFIDCHTKCGERSLERAEELLRFVEGTYRRGDATLKPNSVFYSAILQAWAKSGTVKGADKAEELLRRNIALYEEGNDYAKPQVIVYNAVIDALARSGVENSATRAEELLEEVESLYAAGDLHMKPTRRTFNAVILAYRKEGNASVKAESLLNRMEEMSDGGQQEARPDVVTYNTVIGAIVEDISIADSAADRAQALLDRMEERGVRPDGRTYGAVIEAWLRRNDDKGNALAEAMFAQFQDIVDKKNTKRKSSKAYLYEDAVWDVMNAHRKNAISDAFSSFLE
jgi:pentatricopeptide repeat protein